MKVHYYAVLFLGSLVAQAQMYVSPSSYVYVNDQVLFVKQDVNLNATTSNIYLRKDGQLLQGTTGAGANAGLGALSVYQEGTVNNYAYNYWCSPVGIPVSASLVNNNFGIAQLGIPSIDLDTQSFTAATMLANTVYDGVSGSGTLSIAPYWIWKYITRNMYDPGGPTGWIHVVSAPTLLPGEGFTMKGSSGSDAFTPFVGSGANNPGSAQRYDFRGKPNDGTITVPVDLNKLSLIGNPYPSAIDLRIFLYQSPGLNGIFGDGDDGPPENPNIDGTAMFWEQDKTVASHLIAAYKGGYGVYNGATGVYAPAVYLAYDASGNPAGASAPLNANTGASAFKRRFTPIGQGFMVRGTVNSTIQFKNTYRVYVKEAVANNSQFERISNANKSTTNSNFYDPISNIAGLDYTLQTKLETPHIKINTMFANGAIRQNNLVFMDNALDGYDVADSKSADVDNNLPFDVYFPLLNTEFVQSTTAFNIDKRFPLAFKNTAPATFRIRVGEMVNFTGSNVVFLHDKQTDLYHDILNVDYSMSLPVGIDNTRFEITFKNTTALSTTENVLAENLIVFQNNKNSMLTVKNSSGIALKSFELFDISGKAILSKSKLGSELSYEYSTAGLSEGVYIAKLITETNQVAATKIAISNLK